MNQPLWAHQQAAFDFVRKLSQKGQNGAMLAMAMGLGKSRTAIELAKRMHEVLIVCPLRVVEVWRQQFERFADKDWCFLPLDDRVKSVAEKKRQAENLFRYRPLDRVAIAINYESARTEPFASWALGRTWQMAILDESHKIKQPGGRTSRWAAKLGRQTLSRLALTGTPMPHEPTDIWGQFRFLDPYLLDRSFYEFKLRYAVMGGWNNKEIVSWRDLDKLDEDFRKIAFRVTDEVLDLPEEMDQVLSCTLEPEGERVYREMERHMIAWLDSGEQITAANAMVKLLRLQQITGGHAPNEFGGSDGQIDFSKAELLGDLLDDLAEPVVVFARFRADLLAIFSKALDKRWRPYELSGSHNTLADWQASDFPRSLLAVQIQAGGVGVDLSKARIGVYYSLGFSLSDYLQSRARIRRPPQTRQCVFYHLQAKDSVDEYVLQSVLARRELVDGVLKELKQKGSRHVVA